MCEPVARVLNCEEEDIENESKEVDTKGLEIKWDQLSARERKLAKDSFIGTVMSSPQRRNHSGRPTS